MTRSIVAQLALKDLYLSRWTLVGATGAGAVSLALMPFDTVALYVGSVSFLCVLVVLNIFLVMSGVMQEKKDKVRLFILSLPISTTQYATVKMVANFTAFFVPWLVLTAGSLVVIGASSIPDGLMPIALTVSAYLLAYYCVLLAVAMTTEGQRWPGVVILVGNISVNFIIPVLFRLPSAGKNVSADTAVWGSDVLAVLVAEVFIGALALALASAFYSRKKDFV